MTLFPRFQKSILTVLILLCFNCGTSVAQIKSASVESTTTSSVRDREFEDLANQATFLERQYGLIKQIIRTTRPIVVHIEAKKQLGLRDDCLLYTSPSPRDQRGSRMPSSA